MNLKSIKNIIRNLIVISIFTSIISCVGQKSFPEVENAIYQPYQIDGERGYIVEFEMSNEDIKPTAVVINRIKKNISSADKNGLKYRINIIAQTRKIVNYQVVGSDKENGIFFSTGVKESFERVEFNLKNK